MIRGGMGGGGGLLGALFDMREQQIDNELRRSIDAIKSRQTSVVGSGTKLPHGPTPNVPFLSDAPPHIKTNVRTPDDPALAEFMQDLPQAVLSVSDAIRIAGKLENAPKPGLWQNSVKRIIAALEPGEFIYAFTWNAHCVSMNTNSHKKNYFESHGVAFFSDRRFLFYKDPVNIIDFPITDIYTVGAHKGSFHEGISFRTQDREVQLTFAGEVDRELFRDMVIHIAADAACPLPEVGTEEISAVPEVCLCPGCGASVIIHPGEVNKCKYCDRFVEKQQAPQPAPVSPTVAEELKKFNNLVQSGVISAEEFEEIKARLISQI